MSCSRRSRTSRRGANTRWACWASSSKLGEQQARLDRETSSLSAALRNNKVRGAWGEAQLRNIVESAGLLEHVDFDTQVVMTGVDGKTLRPDMIVHLPGGKTIPIDAKVPYADYQRACMIPETRGLRIWNGVTSCCGRMRKLCVNTSGHWVIRRIGVHATRPLIS